MTENRIEIDRENARAAATDLSLMAIVSVAFVVGLLVGVNSVAGLIVAVSIMILSFVLRFFFEPDEIVLTLRRR